MFSILLAGMALYAQATIDGRVIDWTGSAVPRAQVTISGGSSASLTDDRGEFHISSEPGKYTIRISKEGFESKSMALELTPGRRSLEPIILRVGAVHETITVAESPDYLTAQTSS